MVEHQMCIIEVKEDFRTQVSKNPEVIFIRIYEVLSQALLDHLESQMIPDRFNVLDVRDGVTQKDFVHPG